MPKSFGPRVCAGATARAVVAALALAAVAVPAAAQTTAELYDKAKQEGELVLYGGGPTSLYEVPARAFEQRYPGIKVTIHAGFSNVHNQTINAQLKSGKLDADLAILQTVSDFIDWKKAGVLAAFRPDGWDAIDRTFKDPDGHYVGVFVTAVAYAYNPTLVKPADVPRSALDFLKPEFRGMTISCYPHDDDATLYLFHTLAQKYGADYIDKYLANEPNWVQGHLSVSRSVAAGTNLVTFDATTSTVLNLKKAGQPIEFVFSRVDPIPIYYSTAGIFKDAPHPNVAKLYLTWVLAPEQQSRIGTFSSRNDVPPPAGLKPLFSYTVAKRLSRFRHQRASARRSAPAVRGRGRPDPQHRRGALSARAGRRRPGTGPGFSSRRAL